MRLQAPVERIDVSAYCVPTEEPESDGTLTWDSTTIVVVELAGAGTSGLGYTYAHRAAARLIADTLAQVVEGRDAMNVAGATGAMVRAVRNIGRRGIASMAIAAVDVALWDLKARVLGLPLATLLGRVRDEVPIYGSGGFTSYTIDELRQQLSAWVDRGITRVKMKVGRQPSDDLRRVRAARDAIGRQCELFVDANGAYDRKQALAFARAFAEFQVSWFEEPVPSDDLAGLRLLRDRAPASLEITAGEYGCTLFDFRRMLEARAIDVLQPDATRCGGISGFLAAGALAAAHHVPISAHTAPALHLHPCCALDNVRHLEWFHDHARIESMLFDGASLPVAGLLRPDLSRPGLGLELKRTDAEPYSVL